MKILEIEQVIEWKNLVFIFQPAEEMIADGCLEGVDVIFRTACHKQSWMSEIETDGTGRPVHHDVHTPGHGTPTSKRITRIIMAKMMDLTNEIEQHYEDMVAIRRHMHMHPEVSFEEENTKRYIYEQIKDLGFDIRQDVGGNGIVARLHVSEDYKTVGLRADFDALPIQDEKDVNVVFIHQHAERRK